MGPFCAIFASRRCDWRCHCGMAICCFSIQKCRTVCPPGAMETPTRAASRSTDDVLAGGNDNNQKLSEEEIEAGDAILKELKESMKKRKC